MVAKRSSRNTPSKDAGFSGTSRRGRAPAAAARNEDRPELSSTTGIDADSPVTKWYQLKVLLRRRIERGEYEPGTVFCHQQALMETHGVSYATVARALAELVREGYLMRKRGVGTFVRPQVERRGSGGAIGLLVWDREHILEHPAFSRLVAGLSDPLRAAGHNLSFIFVDAQAELTRPGVLAETVRRAKVRALVAPTQPMLREEHLRPLVEQGLPIVPLNLDVPSLSPCAVHFDIGGAIEMATNHLLDHGYGRVVLMVPDNEEGPRRTAGYRRALQARGIEDELIITQPGQQPLRPVLERALAGLESPAGLIASDDIAALTTVRVAREAGWSVPDRLGVVGVGDFLPPELFEAPLTTVHVPFAVMGRHAAEMAMALLDGRTPSPAVRHLAPRLVVRATTADVGQAINAMATAR